MAESFGGREKEIWESTIDGRISVQVENSRGRPQTLSILGKGQRLRLTSQERVLAEEVVRHDQNNPFRNGMLVHVGGVRGEDIPEVHADELLDDDLAGLFQLKGEDFEDAVRSLSEVNVRRLKIMVAAADASKSQSEFIDEHIVTTWPIGGDTPSNAEARGDRIVTV